MSVRIRVRIDRTLATAYAHRFVARKWWMIGWLCAGLGVACGDGSSASSLPAGALKGETEKAHRVDAAYRGFLTTYEGCLNELNTGELDSAADVGKCMEDGLTASSLEDSLTTLRAQIESVEQAADGDCKAAAHRLVSAIKEQEAVPRALRPAIEAADAGRLNEQFEAWKKAAGRARGVSDALLDACATA
jgi:hypothetical protein